jgi:hypothetical protein
MKSSTVFITLVLTSISVLAAPTESATNILARQDSGCYPL